MSTIAFIGLGNMGGPMAANLVKAGHTVIGVDVTEAAIERHVAAGGARAGSIAEAVAGADAVVTMLPSGREVNALYLGPQGIVANAKAGALFIDSSTIDVDTARAVAKAAAEKGFAMLDGPVSGGVGGAAAGTLTFMCGGEDDTFARAKPLLDQMGKTIVHAGGPGNGQAAKICNNMILGATMVATCEAFALAEKLGLDQQRFFDIASVSSGQSWSMTSYCPVPGVGPETPADRDYQGGFAAPLMLKDLKLALEAAASVGAHVPMGERAEQLYAAFVEGEGAGLDFSGIIKTLR